MGITFVCVCENVCRFPREWEVTSSNRVRSPNDMQFGFSYYYYLQGAVVQVQAADIFDQMDTDHSGLVITVDDSVNDHFSAR